MSIVLHTSFVNSNLAFYVLFMAACAWLSVYNSVGEYCGIMGSMSDDIPIGASDTVAAGAPASPPGDDGKDKPAVVSGVVLQPGQRVLKNGAIFDDNIKRIVANPGGGTAAITKANASDYHAMRQERILQGQIAARNGLGRASISKKGSALAAWADITANMAGYAMTERSIGAVKAAEFVGKAAGLVADKADQGPSLPAGGLLMMIDGASMAAAAQILTDMRASVRQDDGGDDDE